MQFASFPNSATELGSTAYYVVRFSSFEIRNDLAALFLWKQELVNLYALTDPGVARMKLQWWLEQIMLPAEQPSEHALARVIATLIQQFPDVTESIKLMVNETDRHLHRQPYSDFEAFWKGCENIGGSYAHLLNRASGSQVKPEDSVVGAYCIAIEWLQLMGQHLRYNMQLIPKILLTQHDLRFEELLYEDRQAKTRESLKVLLELINNNTGLPLAKRSSSPLYKYYRQRRKLADLLVSENFDVLNQKISLTPIRKLLIAL